MEIFLEDGLYHGCWKVSREQTASNFVRGSYAPRARVRYLTRALGFNRIGRGIDLSFGLRSYFTKLAVSTMTKARFRIDAVPTTTFSPSRRLSAV